MGGIWPDQNTFRHNRNVTTGTVVDRLLCFHWASPDSPITFAPAPPPSGHPVFHLRPSSIPQGGVSLSTNPLSLGRPHASGINAKIFVRARCAQVTRSDFVEPTGPRLSPGKRVVSLFTGSLVLGSYSPYPTSFMGACPHQAALWRQ